MTMLPRAASVANETNEAASRALPLTVGRVQRRLSRLAAASRLLRVAALWLALNGVTVLLDALWPLGAAERWALLVLVVLAALTGVGWAVYPRTERRQDRLQSASRIDLQLGLGPEPVVTALTLDDLSPSPDELTDALRARAQAQGRAAAQPAQPRRVAPLSLLNRPACWLGYAVGGWLLLALMMPALPGRGLMRLFLPGQDVAPYNAVTFDVSWTPQSPTSGETVTVLATAQGRVPETVEAVLLDDNLEPIERREMTPIAAGYELVFGDLREPVTFHLEAFGRRTVRYTITPAPLPAPPVDETISQGSDASGATDPADNDPGAAAQTGDGPPSTGNPTDTALDGAMGQLAGLVNDLAALAERLVDAGEGAESSAAIGEAMDRLNLDAVALAEQLDASAADGDTGLAEALGELAQALRSLEVAGLGSPVQGGSDDETSAADQLWRDAAAQAAQNDAARLAQGLGEAQNAIASGLSNRSGSDPPPDPRDPRATGGYDETVGSGDAGVLPDALIRQVPPRYREQTADYFSRLAEDADSGTDQVSDPNEESP
ncbi:hypothetical protein OT109_18080 [Phycisphaeraceae bacterium D3-23]